jgi:hypothetical protein
MLISMSIGMLDINVDGRHVALYVMWRGCCH